MKGWGIASRKFSNFDVKICAFYWIVSWLKTSFRCVESL